nr:hypothetical protein [Tanacetum cinerariifolium]
AAGPALRGNRALDHLPARAPGAAARLAPLAHERSGAPGRRAAHRVAGAGRGAGRAGGAGGAHGRYCQCSGYGAISARPGGRG